MPKGSARSPTDTLREGSAVRSLLIPAGVIACGLLAALPFRRSVDGPTSGEHAPSVEAIGLPDTVTPLREAPLTAVRPPAGGDRSLTRGRFASLAVPAVNPYSPVLDSLSTSYQEVAIPLALPPDPSNLLDSTPAYSPEQSGSLRRFGIPASAMPGPPRDATPSQDQLAGAAWQPERAIPRSEVPRSEGIPAFVSVLEPQPQSRAAAEAKPGAEPAGPFQTVSETRTPAAKSAPRERMFIREPQ